MTVPIDKDIPIPPHLASGGRHSKYPFRTMRPGDSVLCGGSSLSHAASLISYWRKMLGSGVEFAYGRTDDGTVRIWRVK